MDLTDLGEKKVFLDSQAPEVERGYLDQQDLWAKKATQGEMVTMVLLEDLAGRESQGLQEKTGNQDLMAQGECQGEVQEEIQDLQDHKDQEAFLVLQVHLVKMGLMAFLAREVLLDLWVARTEWQGRTTWRERRERKCWPTWLHRSCRYSWHERKSWFSRISRTKRTERRIYCGSKRKRLFTWNQRKTWSKR